LVVAGAAQIVAAGLIVGIGGSWALSGMLRTLLFGVQPHDWVTMTAACLVLAVAAAAAAFLPAHRASQLMPVDALRVE
jgi:ABC-type antimicrobial peptide transport system permease subunit